MRTESDTEARIRRSLRELDNVPVTTLRLRELEARTDRGPTRRLAAAVFVGMVAALTVAVTIGLRGYWQAPGAGDRVTTTTASTAAPAASPSVLIAGVSGRIYQVGGAMAWTIDTCRDQRVLAIQVAPDAKRALVLCGMPSTGDTHLYRMDLGARTAVDLAVHVAYRSDGLAWDPTGTAFVALVPGPCPTGGSGCNAVVQVDATTGIARTLRSAEAGTGHVRTTSLGLSVFRGDGAERGTYLLTATGWERLSEHRLIVADGSGRAALLQDDLGVRGSVVWLRVDGLETALTDRAHEEGYALGFTPGGDAVVYRIAGTGAIVTYRDGKPIRVQPANFCATAVQSGTRLFCVPPGSNAIVSYDLATGSLSSVPMPEDVLAGTLAAGPSR